jgi:hypothetical protein
MFCKKNTSLQCIENNYATSPAQFAKKWGFLQNIPNISSWCFQSSDCIEAIVILQFLQSRTTVSEENGQRMNIMLALRHAGFPYQ